MNRMLEIRERIARYGLELDGHNRGAWDRARDDLEVHAYSDLRYLMDEIAALKADRDAWRRRAEAAERDLQMAGWGNQCEVCAYYDAPFDDPNCKECDNEPGKSGFKWRGQERDK